MAKAKNLPALQAIYRRDVTEAEAVIKSFMLIYARRAAGNPDEMGRLLVTRARQHKRLRYALLAWGTYHFLQGLPLENQG